MNSSSYDNLENCNEAPAENSIGAELAERLRSAIGLPGLPESKASNCAAGEKGENKESLPLPGAVIGEKGAFVFCSTSLKDGPPAKDATPVKDAAQVKDAAPVKDAAQVKDAAPVKDAAQVKDSAPVKDAPPVKDSAETKEQRLDQKIKDNFGADVFEHLKDWDWLIANRKKLEEGFKKIENQDTKWDMAWRMKELSTVDGKALIYLSKVDSASKGSLIPKRYDINLRRGSFRSDDYIGHLTR